MLAEACLASQRAVGGKTRVPRPGSGRCKLDWQVGGRAKVDLVRRLAREGGMGYLGVVLLDVEFDEGAEPLDRVQGVEVEPLVLERAPESLNHRVREGDLDLGVANGQIGYLFHRITGDPGPTPYWPPPPHSGGVSRVVSDDERSELALDTTSECGTLPRGWVPDFRW